MNWKQFRAQTDGVTFQDEDKFIIGIDIGSKMTKIALWNVNGQQPELIDMSGGYGTPAVPTIVQYIPENKEWIYGEYALLNQGFFQDITIDSFTNRLGTKELIDIDDKPVNIPSLLSRYIKEMMENCKNVNPKGEIVGIVAAVPNYFSENEKEELRRAFILAGLEKELITFMPETECVIRYLDTQQQMEKPEKILVIDYGEKELRGSLLEIIPEKEEQIKINSWSALFDSQVGLKELEKIIKDNLIRIYCEKLGSAAESITNHILRQIELLAYQNKRLLFQNYYDQKPTKLYFNFAYPAFQITILPETVEQWIKPIKEKIKPFLRSLVAKTIYGNVSVEQIQKIVMTGGGFEINWIYAVVKEVFASHSIEYVKMPEGAVSLGACVASASFLGIIPDTKINIKDQHRLCIDIGIEAISGRQPKFVSLIERNTFWWQKHESQIFILDEDSKKPSHIQFYKRNEKGEINDLAEIELKHLPSRPPRTTRLKLILEFITLNQIKGKIVDCGFGEFFPATDWIQTFFIDL